jgi:hypothetical protein
MANQLSWSCEKHPSPSDCPDALIGRFAGGRFGLFVHDGGTSRVEIEYCPWCGTHLNSDTRI